MIALTRLYCGIPGAGDAMRYAPGVRAAHRPIVVWNCTRRCNLRCVHCYARSCDSKGGSELTTAEGRALLDDLARYQIPAVLFSGGEPLLRPDLFELIGHATRSGLRAVVSTNGTLIDREAALRLRDGGVSYVGISLDGSEPVNDRFRGVTGAWRMAVEGIRQCRAVGLRMGLRFTITRSNVDEVPAIFALADREGVPRLCFYHLVYSGRGVSMISDDLDRDATRRVMDRIISHTAALHAWGCPVEVLTVDNHADGPYLLLRMQRERHAGAAQVEELLRRNGGNASGERIGCVSWDGAVHADQFWRHISLGNVREQPFSAIWEDASHPLLSQLRDRHRHLKGRCAACRFAGMCGGNFRVRAEAATGDLWASDPACYLTDAEIQGESLDASET